MVRGREVRGEREVSELERRHTQIERHIERKRGAKRVGERGRERGMVRGREVRREREVGELDR